MDLWISLPSHKIISNIPVTVFSGMSYFSIQLQLPHKLLKRFTWKILTFKGTTSEMNSQKHSDFILINTT